MDMCTFWFRRSLQYFYIILASSSCIHISSNFFISVLILLSILANQINPDDVTIDFWPCFRFSWLVSKHSWRNIQYFVLNILNSIIVCILLISVFSILHFSVFCIFLYTFVIGEQTDLMHGAVVGESKQTVNRELKRQEIVRQTLPMFAFYWHWFSTLLTLLAIITTAPVIIPNILSHPIFLRCFSDVLFLVIYRSLMTDKRKEESKRI